MFKPTSLCFPFGAAAAMAIICAVLVSTSPAAALTTNQHAGKAKTEQVAKRTTQVTHTRSVAHAGAKKKASKKASTESARPANRKPVHKVSAKTSSRKVSPIESKRVTRRS